MFTEPVLFDTASLPTPEAEVAGIGYRLLISAEQTGGAYELMYFEVPPGFASPQHMHSREDECTMTLEGDIEGTVGDQVVQVPAGSVLHLPRGVPHRCRNVGDRTAKFLIWVTPGNLAGFYETCQQPSLLKEQDANISSGCASSAARSMTDSEFEMEMNFLVETASRYGIAILPA